MHIGTCFKNSNKYELYIDFCYSSVDENVADSSDVKGVIYYVLMYRSRMFHSTSYFSHMQHGRIKSPTSENNICNIIKIDRFCPLNLSIDKYIY